MELTYDPALLEFESAASAKDGFGLLETKHDTPGEIRMVAASSGSQHVIQGDMQLLTLVFRAKDVEQTITARIRKALTGSRPRKRI